jgi:hypothetical protein
MVVDGDMEVACVLGSTAFRSQETEGKALARIRTSSLPLQVTILYAGHAIGSWGHSTQGYRHRIILRISE